MHFFFRSRQFKILLISIAAIAVLSIIAAVLGGALTPQSSLISAITSPFESVAADISAFFKDAGKRFQNNEKAILENAELQKEIDSLREQLAEYDEAVRQNKFYENYLEIKDQNKDFQFQPAEIIARDTDDPFGSFVINKGSLNDISQYDPIITDAGLVGYVSKVGLTTSKVTTILSPRLKVGALDNRTGDSGVITGDITLSQKGLCKMNNLIRSGKIAVGDYVVSSGEGIFPAGLLIGEISAIGNDAYTGTLYASVTPFTDISSLRSVMAITYFPGQGSEKVTAND